MNSLKSSKDLEDYWGESNITPDTLDNFFDEDNTVPWTGSFNARKTSPEEQKRISLISRSSGEYDVSFSAASITDNITTDDGNESSLPSKMSTSVSSHSIGRSLGSIGGKLQDWKPTGVKIFTGEKGMNNCTNCTRLERQIQQFSSQYKPNNSHENVALPVSVTINKMILGQSFNLQGYTSLSDKKDLLQSALYIGDTSTVLAIILFCKNSLSKNLFMSELQQTPELAKMYVRHLKQRRQINESVEILTSLGRLEEAALLKYKQCLQMTDHNKKIRSLKQVSNDYFKHLPHAHYNNLVNNYADLLEQQIVIDTKDSGDNVQTSNPLFREYPRASNIHDKPLLTTLYYCCMYHWSAGDNNSPVKLRQKYRINDKQFLWTVLRGRARVKHYYLPDQLFALINTKSGMLGALSSAISTVSGIQTSSLKHYLPLERVVDTLKQTSAPETILTAYLSLVEPKDLRLRLALQHGVKQAVVEAYIALKDRAGLHSFHSNHLMPGSADYIKAENALKAMP